MFRSVMGGLGRAESERWFPDPSCGPFAHKVPG